MNLPPLAERMRPTTLDDLVGQEHLTGRGGILRTAIESGKIPSCILWGPPGTGKTTIANIIAHTLKVPFSQLSAISSGVKDVREAIAQAQTEPGTILFIDEIHRFNKGQQDALLGAVEKGTITLIGATTENPSFEVNSALLSRCQVYVLKPLNDEALVRLMHHAIAHDEVLKKLNIELKETEALIRVSGGDARKLLNLLELVCDALGVEQGPHPGLPPTGEGASPQPVIHDQELMHVENATTNDLSISIGEFYMEADPSTYHILKSFVSENGRNPTPAEEKLWQQLKGNKLEGYSFRRQHIIGNYIADFVYLEKQLIIELDGLAHQLPDNKASDEARTLWLNNKGYTVSRFTNDDVLNNLPKVLAQIKHLLKTVAPTPKKIFKKDTESVQSGERSAASFPRGGKAGMGALLITNEKTLHIAQQRIALYDKSGEQHYDIISAFIKSMRGSDPNAAVYWLARMIEGGEDVKFIARRMVIFASEDVGNANANALLLANACFDAVTKIGYPESRIILAQCATYLASSQKSNAAYMAIEEALEVVRKQGDLPVPLDLRNAKTGLMKSMGYGKEYKYAHNYAGNFTEQEFLPDAIKGTTFYNPGKNQREEELRKFLKALWKEKYGY